MINRWTGGLTISEQTEPPIPAYADRRVSEQTELLIPHPSYPQFQRSLQKMSINHPHFLCLTYFWTSISNFESDKQIINPVVTYE